MDGSATFTTVLSSMIMNRPKETAASVHHFRFSGAKACAAMRALTRRDPLSRLARTKLATTSFVGQAACRLSRAVAEIVWTPDEATLAHANVVRLMRRLGVSDYRELVR